MDPAVERIQQAYREVRDLRGSFTQKSHIKDLERTDTYQGTFLIKLPSKFRWQYKGEERQQAEVIINEEELIVYQKKERQAFRSRFDSGSYGQAPIALLSGLGNIEGEFDVSRKGSRLVLRPRKQMGNVASVEITPSEEGFPIAAIAIVDSRSNRIEIMLRDVTVNSGIKDDAFVFSLPRGVSLFER